MFTSFMAQDILSFVDVRFIAHNKNPNNNRVPLMYKTGFGRGKRMGVERCVFWVLHPTLCVFG